MMIRAPVMMVRAPTMTTPAPAITIRALIIPWRRTLLFGLEVMLEFSRSPGGTEPSHADDLIIGALSDMELMDQSDGSILADGVDGDDLLELDLMELEDSQSQQMPIEDTGRSNNTKSTRTTRPGVKRNAPLGINNRKFEILRRGSPIKRSAATGSHVEGAAEKP
ncbi:hypothetical protein DY000_02010434 [Brassica cretica]|uniref:Uncharacterized protein n=1 Tax=Brassica cretica TaxID=69181 RepID=A0ABQ7BS61_BRACR|nr:hypothetical protein DY000_02010434 [Brassica cretica]